MKYLFALFAAFLSFNLPWECPAYQEDENKHFVQHAGYSLLYDERYEQARWVAYELNENEVKGSYERTNKFLEDPLVPTGSAEGIDYKSSGYDRGHLAPAADMGFSEKTMVESFYYSNMSPQAPSFNRGVWKRLEEQVRDWALQYHQVFVVTGPILRPKLPSIGPNEVAVPEFYYKVILDTSSQHRQMISFILPNEGSSASLKSFVVSTDSLENLTKINFYPKLKEEIEHKLESKSNIQTWKWNE
jgi:endonuclease G